MLAKPFNPKTATEEEILARVLYRDGLMLVIDKPAGLRCIAGRRAGRAWRIGSTRCATACRAGRSSRTGSTARPPVAWCSAAIARRLRTEPAVQAPPRRQDLLGGGRRRAHGGRRRDRHAAGAARSGFWLVDEARSGRAAGGDEMEGDGALRRPHARLARARAGHRAHASAARALRRDGLSDFRR